MKYLILITLIISAGLEIVIGKPIPSVDSKEVTGTVTTEDAGNCGPASTQPSISVVNIVSSTVNIETTSGADTIPVTSTDRPSDLSISGTSSTTTEPAISRSVPESSPNHTAITSHVITTHTEHFIGSTDSNITTISSASTSQSVVSLVKTEINLVASSPSSETTSTSSPSEGTTEAKEHSTTQQVENVTPTAQTYLGSSEHGHHTTEHSTTVHGETGSTSGASENSLSQSTTAVHTENTPTVESITTTPSSISTTTKAEHPTSYAIQGESENTEKVHPDHSHGKHTDPHLKKLGPGWHHIKDGKLIE